MKTCHRLARPLVACAVALAATSISAAPASAHGSGQHGHGHSALRAAKRATAPYHRLANAQAAGYTDVVVDVAGNTCIAEPGMGAMGVHYLNPALVDDKVEASKPEAVVYEPRANGRLKLVALEYLVFQDAWDATHSRPPKLFGHEFMLTTSPNRYGVPAFYALHAWIWKFNPSGTLAMWNPRVHCP
jgi:hypothetical protein